MDKLVQKLVRDELQFRRKLAILKYAHAIGNDSKTCQDLNINRSTFYSWKRAFQQGGREGLRRKKPIAYTHPKKIAPEIAEKILQIRRSYQLGPERIMWYLERYHGIQVSDSSVYRILARNGVNRLPEKAPRRALHTKRYAKTVPGHHIQVDVKFLTLKDPEGQRVRRFQYTAIDDATRIRALRIYPRHTQSNAISFMDYVVEKFPFRIHTIRTDRGHEFQAQFHWHVEDQGMRHVYIKPRSPQLNGKVERSHRTDKDEFYQLLTYTGDVDLGKKLEVWERFYNMDRPHASLDGQTPYEVMRCLLD
ncbi:IS481 family transposase [Candidatus Neomarinimicrobiota bacterium]